LSGSGTIASRDDFGDIKAACNGQRQTAKVKIIGMGLLSVVGLVQEIDKLDMQQTKKSTQRPQLEIFKEGKSVVLIGRAPEPIRVCCPDQPRAKHHTTTIIN